MLSGVNLSPRSGNTCAAAWARPGPACAITSTRGLGGVLLRWRAGGAPRAQRRARRAAAGQRGALGSL